MRWEISADKGRNGASSPEPDKIRYDAVHIIRLPTQCSRPKLRR